MSTWRRTLVDLPPRLDLGIVVYPTGRATMVKRFLCSFFLAVALLLTGIREAHASLVVPRSVPLDVLVSHSSLILIVRSVPPFVSREPAPVAGPKGERGRCPPYQPTLYHFAAKEILHNRTDKIPKGPMLVREADAGVLQAMQAQSCAGQPVPWPIVDSYSPSFSWKVEEKKETDLIVFLIESEGNWEFTMSGAYESIAKKRDVLAALKKKGKR
jgi:hypothetical protein